jgi:hypothetical protein
MVRAGAITAIELDDKELATFHVDEMNELLDETYG